MKIKVTQKEYKKIRDPALAKYEKVHGSAWAEYKKIRDKYEVIE